MRVSKKILCVFERRRNRKLWAFDEGVMLNNILILCEILVILIIIAADYFWHMFCSWVAQHHVRRLGFETLADHGQSRAQPRDGWIVMEE